MSADMRSAFHKAGIGGGGGEMQKKCRICGKHLKPDSRFDTCFECGAKGREGGDIQISLPAGYLDKLKKGYFDSNHSLWEDFVTTTASDIARSFGKKNFNNHQLRRFYGHIKAAENRLRMAGDWPSVNVDVKKIGPFVAEAKGKGKVPESFYLFVDGNMKAISTKEDFFAFVQHFEAIVAYYTYHYKNN